MKNILKIALIKISNPLSLFLYKTKIKNILKNEKKIVFFPKFYGLGDLLVFSTLPELLHKQYNVKFYLHKECAKNIPDYIFELCFKCNPYFKGISSSKRFTPKVFSSDKGNLVEIYEKQFNLTGNGVPKIYYSPNYIEKYKDICLVDLNIKTGQVKRHNYNLKNIEDWVEKNELHSLKRHYIDIQKQNIFKYIDMIYSSKCAVFLFSGGSVISACLNKNSIVLLPYEICKNSRYGGHFVFNNSTNVNYINSGTNFDK
jgi:hypothetical protein